MERVSIEQLRKIAEECYDDIADIAEENGRDVMIYLHWTAGHYGQFFEDYHINIDEDGTIYISTDDLSEIKSHTWRRNSGAVGIALACAYNASPDDLGEEPPTRYQVDTMAEVVAVLCKAFRIPCDIYHVLTHAEAADNKDDDKQFGDDDLYGPENGCERWDLWKINGIDGGKYIRSRAIRMYGAEV